MEEPKKGESPKVKLDVTNLGADWERQEAIRLHLKEQDGKYVLFEDHIQESVKHAVFPHIHAVLTVLLTRASAVKGSPQPCVNPLRDQLTLLYQKCSREPDEAVIINDSWMVRKMMAFVKMKTRLKKVSTAACRATMWHACVVQVPFKAFSARGPEVPRAVLHTQPGAQGESP